MDDTARSRLFDPRAAHALVLTHRPAPRSAVTAVVSDVVWHEVVSPMDAVLNTGGALLAGSAAVAMSRSARLPAR